MKFYYTLPFTHPNGDVVLTETQLLATSTHYRNKCCRFSTFGAFIGSCLLVHLCYTTRVTL